MTVVSSTLASLSTTVSVSSAVPAGPTRRVHSEPLLSRCSAANVVAGALSEGRGWEMAWVRRDASWGQRRCATKARLGELRHSIIPPRQGCGEGNGTPRHAASGFVFFWFFFGNPGPWVWAHARSRPAAVWLVAVMVRPPSPRIEQSAGGSALPEDSQSQLPLLFR